MPVVIRPITITVSLSIDVTLMVSPSTVPIYIIASNGARKINCLIRPACAVVFRAYCHSRKVTPISINPTQAPNKRLAGVHCGHPGPRPHAAATKASPTVKLTNMMARGSERHFVLYSQ